MSRFVGLLRANRMILYRIERDALTQYAEQERDALTQYVETQYRPQWRRDVRLLGSCRSTLCIYKVANREVALWNPLTDELRILPPADADRPFESGLSFDQFKSDRRNVHRLVVSVYVFGFDERNAEYVLLRVVQKLPRSNFAEVSIYRERDPHNMWRPLEGRPYFLVEPGRMGVSLRDRLYWLMRRSPGPRLQDTPIVLVAFDISTNSCVDVDLPHIHNIDHRWRMDLAVLGGHLCLIIYGPQSRVDVRIKRYNGSEQPWEQLFLLNAGNFRSVQPLAYFHDDLNKVLVEVGTSENKTLGCYNLLTRQLQLNVMPWPFDEFDEATYLSLRF